MIFKKKFIISRKNRVILKIEGWVWVWVFLKMLHVGCRCVVFSVSWVFILMHVYARVYTHGVVRACVARASHAHLLGWVCANVCVCACASVLS